MHRSTARTESSTLSNLQSLLIALLLIYFAYGKFFVNLLFFQTLYHKLTIFTFSNISHFEYFRFTMISFLLAKTEIDLTEWTFYCSLLKRRSKNKRAKQAIRKFNRVWLHDNGIIKLCYRSHLFVSCYVNYSPCMFLQFFYYENLLGIFLVCEWLVVYFSK